MPCLFAPFGVGLDLEAHALAGPGARRCQSVGRGKRADVDKDLISPGLGSNKAKATLVVPLCDTALKTHASPLPLEQRAHATFIEHRHAQLLRLGELAARVRPGDDVMRLLAD